MNHRIKDLILRSIHKFPVIIKRKWAILKISTVVSDMRFFHIFVLRKKNHVIDGKKIFPKYPLYNLTNDQFLALLTPD